MARNNTLCRLFAITAAAVWASTPVICGAVEFANIDVADGSPQINGVPTVTIASGQGTANFQIRSNAQTGIGQFAVQIGASALDDFGTLDTTDNAGGVMVAYVRESGRLYPTSDSSTETLYASNSIGLAATGVGNPTTGVAGLDGFWIFTDRAGTAGATSLIVPGAQPAPQSAGTANHQMNANIAAAYFPFSEGWVGATVLNSGNGAAFNRVLGSPGITLTNIQKDANGSGDNLLTLPGVQDSRRQGILFPMHAKNEDNYGTSSPLADGTGWNLTTRQNTSDGGGGESDPVAFVFLPLGTPNITMGVVHGGSGQFNLPTAMIKSGSPFTLGKESNGRYRLTIPGQSPTSGVLLVASNGNFNGDGGLAADNLTTYQATPENDGWIILTDDLPNAEGTSQVSNYERQSEFSFAFLPFVNGPTAPAATLPALRWTPSSVFGFNATINEIDGTDNDDNNIVGTWSTISGTPNLDFQPLRTNRADFATAIDGAFPVRSEGVLFVSTAQGKRNNSATFGNEDYGLTQVTLEDDVEQWEVHTHVSDPTQTQLEHNINYSAAFFGANSGFTMQASVNTDANSHLDVTIPGVNSLSGGVLMSNAISNEPNYVTVAPKSDGSGWNLDLYSHDTQREHLTTQAAGEVNPVNYIYLPYTTQNLVAGRVEATGSIINSTNPSGFTLSKTGTGEYTLTINGRTPEQGMLLLNSTGAGDDADNTMFYEASGGSFKITGIDLVTIDQRINEMLSVAPEDTAFSFAFIDFVTPPVPGPSFSSGNFTESGGVDNSDLTNWIGTSTPLTGFGMSTGATHMQGDADGDHDVDGSDFLIWQSQYGAASSSAAGQGVPEPSAMALALVVGLALAARVSNPRI